MLWRTMNPVYILPVLNKRLRVILDWTGHLLFDRDIARLTFMKRQGEAEDSRDLNVVDEFW